MPHEERSAYLQEMCPDESIRHESEAMIELSPDNDAFPRLRLDKDHANRSREEGGPYRIEERIGSGGMGEVLPPNAWKSPGRTPIHPRCPQPETGCSSPKNCATTISGATASTAVWSH